MPDIPKQPNASDPGTIAIKTDCTCQVFQDTPSDLSADKSDIKTSAIDQDPSTNSANTGTKLAVALQSIIAPYIQLS